MSTKELAIINKGPKRYEFSTIFDGERYFLNFEYNDRNDTWYLTIKDSIRDEILKGVALLTNVESMLSRFVVEDFMLAGDLIVADSQLGSRDPGYDNFGDGVSAYYTSILS